MTTLKEVDTDFIRNRVDLLGYHTVPIYHPDAWSGKVIDIYSNIITVLATYYDKKTDKDIPCITWYYYGMFDEDIPRKQIHRGLKVKWEQCTALKLVE